MKKLLSVLLALVMALGLLTTTAWADTHTNHCVCGGNYTGTGGHTTHTNETWTAWNNGDSLPTTAGNYYLTQNVTITAAQKIPNSSNYTNWLISSGSINLCLNGFTIKATDTNNDFITIQDGASLTITDCKGKGMVTGGYHIAAVQAGGTFNLYGGKITGRTSKACGSVFVAGTFNMYGGTITGNETEKRSDGLGGGGVYNEGIFKMYGGIISENKSANDGGGVYNKRTFDMYGGTISGNTGKNGAGVYNGTNGDFTLSGGTISGNTATGGNDTADAVYNAGTMKASGGVVSGTVTSNDPDKFTAEEYLWVTFDANGGSPEPATQHLYGGNLKAVKPANPTREGYRFLYWYDDDTDNDTDRYDFDTVVTYKRNLKAKWELISAEPVDDSVDDPVDESAMSGGHTPIRRQHTTTDTTVTDTTVTDTTKVDTVTSAKTFDVGSAVYGVMAVASLLGMGYVGRKR